MTDTVVKPCPFCGFPPYLSTLGSCITIECCAGFERQKCDYLTIEERGSWDIKTHRFGDKEEMKVLKAILEEWNTRHEC